MEVDCINLRLGAGLLERQFDALLSPSGIARQAALASLRALGAEPSGNAAMQRRGGVELRGEGREEGGFSSAGFDLILFHLSVTV